MKSILVKSINFLSIAFCLLLSSTNANSKENTILDASIQRCSLSIDGAISLAAKIHSKVPDTPNNLAGDLENKYWSENMFTLRDEPYFLTWKLKFELSKAIERLKDLKKLRDVSTEQNLIVAGGLVTLISDTRNSWTEFEAYSNDYDPNAWNSAIVNSQMRSLSGAISSYIICVSQHVN